ncbi:uncharacterized protein METZ01_LOCUS235513 [marine metagenome]|jgi:hypothetical protein|uniref:Methyltransferase domain-containing protein n=1 Tax=marine metagenome TaxID=408172 RepID=A0A382H656_9ZZZZ|tara:strand:+ start:146 stop:667 length:522 start_codon:yes stop_codon:yes gene_type:complete
MNGFERAVSSHMDTLEKLFSSNKIKTVFEFGCGRHSTKFFLEQGCHVWACEQQNQDWYNRIKQQHVNWAAKEEDLILKLFLEKDDPSIAAKFEAINYMVSLNRRFDMVFVDGHKDSRWCAINEAANYTNIIVTHDTEDKENYHWDRISLNGWNEYSVQRPSGGGPQTTWWTKI